MRVVMVLIIIAALVGAYYLTREAPPAQMEVWVVGESVKVRPYDPPEAHNLTWDGKRRIVRLYGARNEYVGFQIVVRAGGRDGGGITFAVADLRQGEHTLSRENIEVFREHYLEVTVPSQYDARHPIRHGLGPGEYPVQMVPLGNYESAERLVAGRNQPFWVDLYVPEDTAPGEYTGTWQVQAWGGPKVELKVSLTVWNFTLPHETHFKTFFYYGPEQIRWAFPGLSYEEFLAVERQFYQLAHQHRMNLATEPEVSDGNFPWGKWWARFGPYLDGSAYKERVGRGVGACLWPIRLDPAASEENFKAACRSVVAFFEPKGLLDRLFVFSIDEPNSRQDYETVRRLGRWIDEAVGDKLPLMLTEQIRPQNPAWGSLVGYVDIWNSGQSSLEEMAVRRAAGDRIWVYNAGLAGEPYIDTPGLEMRTWAWAAWRFDLEAWHFWDTCYWRQKHFGVQEMTKVWHDPLTFDETRRIKDGRPYPAEWALRLNGDGVLFYPGSEVGITGPIGCFRLKAFRRGAQDYEYLYLLAKAGQKATADRLAEHLLPRPHQWKADPEAWDRARLEMGSLINSGG